MCNCRKDDSCLLNGQYLADNVVYNAEVKVEVLSTMTYIGSANCAFKGGTTTM